ncbi:MAG: MSMEG_0565 family glycosyltransferase [Leptolyngbya sp. RL_3_1]|nr:MSMEG_0565 family glycosyltransferase [Leptolyngbya sp. RL_3_1]
MHIALLTYATKPRGSVIHTLELAAALTTLGHHVCIFALDKDGLGFEQPPHCAVQLVPAAPAPAGIDALIQQRIQEFVDFLVPIPEQFNIYHAQDCIGANALLMLRQRGNIPHFVRTVHHVEAYASPYLQHCQEQSIREPDRCLCVSDRWQAVLKIDYGITAPKVTNGVNLDRFSAVPAGTEGLLKQRYGLMGSPTYLTVGGIEPRKNSIHLLEAFAQVLETHAAAQLVIAGGATLFDYQPYREEFFAAAKTLGIAVGRSLLLPGVIPATDLPGLYRCADVFCFPSLQEGWGLVVLEAIASGLPVIVSDQAPFTEFLDRDQALWVDPAQPATIVTAMVQAITPDCTGMIQRSQSILSRYSWRASAQLHEAEYRQLMGAAFKSFSSC